MLVTYFFLALRKNRKINQTLFLFFPVYSHCKNANDFVKSIIGNGCAKKIKLHCKVNMEEAFYLFIEWEYHQFSCSLSVTASISL